MRMPSGKYNFTLSYSSYVHSLTYPDFVAFLDQENTPPGGVHTISAWIKWAGISLSSNVYDFACSTGFSSRVIALKTGCVGFGIDLSERAVMVARRKACENGLGERLSFEVGDLVEINKPDGFFSHVLAGCNFAFVQQRELALKETHRLLRENGLLCVAGFFYHDQPPSLLIDAVESVIGFRPEVFWTDGYWKSFFSQAFILERSAIHDLPVIEEKVLQRQVRESIDQSSQIQETPNMAAVSYERLLIIRRVLNEHRRYQRYSVQIWRKK